MCTLVGWNISGVRTAFKYTVQNVAVESFLNTTLYPAVTCDGSLLTSCQPVNTVGR